MAIQVLIVDDSAVVRKVLTEMLNSASGIEVMATAPDPIFAEQRISKTKPDVIVLDVEMPRMDGLTFLKKLMQENPLPVVMCSTLTAKGSRTSMEALAAGAVEIIEKPKTDLKNQLPEATRQLVQAVRAAAKANMSRVRRKPVSPMNLQVPEKLTADAMLSAGGSSMQHRGKLVAIGTSTGGTQALEDVLPSLPLATPPILIVQHMPEKFTSAFATRLNGISQITVKEAVDGEPLQPGTAYIAPGGRHLMMGNGPNGPVTVVKDGPAVSRHKPSVDVLFRSVAKISGSSALGIIMTGMGDDGAAGLKEMRDKGAFTVGQDQQSCVVYGMPAAAFERGAVCKQISLQRIPQCIVDYAAGKKLAG